LACHSRAGGNPVFNQGVGDGFLPPQERQKKKGKGIENQAAPSVPPETFSLCLPLLHLSLAPNAQPEAQLLSTPVSNSK
jgi:hypothetical protein